MRILLNGVEGGRLTDVVAKDFAMTLGTTLSQTFSAFTTSYHASSVHDQQASFGQQMSIESRR